GLPPLAGFWGKFAVFASLVDSYQLARSNGEEANYLIWLLVIGGLNTAISLFYYLRVVKVMTMDQEPKERPPFAHPVGFFATGFVLLTTIQTLVWMICGDYLSLWSNAAVQHLF